MPPPSRPACEFSHYCMAASLWLTPQVLQQYLWLTPQVLQQYPWLHHRYSNNIHGYASGTPTISMVTPQVLQQYPWLHLRLPTRSSDGGTNMVMSSVVTCPMSNAHVQHCTVRPHLSAPWIYKRWRGKWSGYARLVPSPSTVVFI